jgi:xanthine dehydrogenase accessory factor
MSQRLAATRILDEDHEALAAACEQGFGLCTIIGIEGSFSRRLGAQLAIESNGTTVGSLADSCLEAQLASDIRCLNRPQVIRYGAGSDKIDFRLPCGGGLDILLDPEPDRTACREVLDTLMRRAPACLALPRNSQLTKRYYQPSLRIAAFGEGPELGCLEMLAQTMRIDVSVYDKSRLSLGRPAIDCPLDRWSAALFLFHDHEWEAPLLEQVLASEVFFVGAQGGENARITRSLALAARGLPEERIARISSPVGLMPSCKTPSSLALSAIAEVVAHYEQLRARA